MTRSVALDTSFKVFRPCGVLSWQCEGGDRPRCEDRLSQSTAKVDGSEEGSGAHPSERSPVIHTAVWDAGPWRLSESTCPLSCSAWMPEVAAAAGLLLLIGPDAKSELRGRKVAACSICWMQRTKRDEAGPGGSGYGIQSPDAQPGVLQVALTPQVEHKVFVLQAGHRLF